LSLLRTIAEESLIFAAKQIPVVGKAVDLAASIKTQHDIAFSAQLICEATKRLNPMEMELRASVRREIERILHDLSRPARTREDISLALRHLKEIRNGHWGIVIFEGLLSGDGSIARAGQHVVGSTVLNADRVPVVCKTTGEIYEFTIDQLERSLKENRPLATSGVLRETAGVLVFSGEHPNSALHREIEIWKSAVVSSPLWTAEEDDARRGIEEFERGELRSALVAVGSSPELLDHTILTLELKFWKEAAQQRSLTPLNSSSNRTPIEGGRRTKP